MALTQISDQTKASIAAGAVVYDVATHDFLLNGQPMTINALHGVADAMVNDARFRIADLSLKLQQGTLSAADWYAGMQTELVQLHGAQVALSRGGFEMMNEAAWEKAAKLAANQLEYLRGFAEDVVAGRYGANIESADSFLQRAQMYAEAGRATYENERMSDTAETLGHTEAQRLLGAVDHCSDCVEWAGMDWMPIDEMMANYPIGASVCHVNCITTPWSRVLTKRGWVAISQVVIGDFVWTHKHRWRCVTATMKNYSQGIRQGVKIQAPTGEMLGATNDHEFYTPDGWITLGEIVNDELSLYNVFHESSYTKMRRMFTAFVCSFKTAAVQALREYLRVRKAERLASRIVQSVRKSRLCFEAMGITNSATMYDSILSKSWTQAACPIWGFIVGIVQRSENKRWPLVRLLLGCERDKTYNLSVSMGVDYPQWTDTGWHDRSSHQWGLHRRQDRELADNAQPRARSIALQTPESTNSRNELLKLRGTVQAKMENEGQGAEVLLSELPLHTPLWDITVEEDHSFCLEGFFAHNCHCVIITR